MNSLWAEFFFLPLHCSSQVPDILVRLKASCIPKASVVHYNHLHRFCPRGLSQCLHWHRMGPRMSRRLPIIRTKPSSLLLQRLCNQNCSLLFHKVPFSIPSLTYHPPPFFHLQTGISTNHFLLYSQLTASMTPASHVPQFLLALCLFSLLPKGPVPPSSLLPEIILLLLQNWVSCYPWDITSALPVLPRWLWPAIHLSPRSR